MNRPAKFFRWLSAIALAGICACSSQAGKPQTAASTAQAAESARVAPVVEKYKKQGVLTGFDFKGTTTLVVFADTEKYSELDDSLEESMKSDLLASWSSAWKRNHPHQHAKLYVIFQNYYGQEITRLQKQL